MLVKGAGLMRRMATLTGNGQARMIGIPVDSEADAKRLDYDFVPLGTEDDGDEMLN